MQTELAPSEFRAMESYSIGKSSMIRINGRGDNSKMTGGTFPVKTEVEMVLENQSRLPP
jgi:hypothetical protein